MDNRDNIFDNHSVIAFVKSGLSSLSAFSCSLEAKIHKIATVFVAENLPYTRILLFFQYSLLISEETDLIAFYDELSSLVRSIPKHNVLVIGRGMNAQIGKNVNHKFSLHNTSSRNGQYLTDFKVENRLTCKLSEKGGKTMDLNIRKQY